jgi:hypothetical protein
MSTRERTYRAVVSSDWSECLSPNGPFDPISFNFPHLREELASIFGQYTGNAITLKSATTKIAGLLEQPLTKEMMDAYLDAAFETYVGVPELIEWCLSNDILFMINTTGTQGYFQRIIARKLIPPVPVVAANPMISYAEHADAGRFGREVLEIEDKPKNTESVIRSLKLSARDLIVMGDSGGDGPHFRWGGAEGAYLIGSMTKASLDAFCLSCGTEIDLRFGVVYGPGEKRDSERERKVNFKDLIDIIKEVFNLRS